MASRRSLGIAVAQLWKKVCVFSDQRVGYRSAVKRLIEAEGVAGPRVTRRCGANAPRIELLEGTAELRPFRSIYRRSRGHGLQHVALRVDDLLQADRARQSEGDASCMPAARRRRPICMNLVHPVRPVGVLLELIQKEPERDWDKRGNRKSSRQPVSLDAGICSARRNTALDAIWRSLPMPT